MSILRLRDVFWGRGGRAVWKAVEIRWERVRMRAQHGQRQRAQSSLMLSEYTDSVTLLR